VSGLSKQIVYYVVYWHFNYDFLIGAHGMSKIPSLAGMEWWNDGILGNRNGKTQFILFTL